jgi:predicted nucleic acid-binding protein
LRGSRVELVRYEPGDEVAAIALLEKYQEHSLSFHDALCSVVMLRLGLFQIFTYDSDFAILGFVSIPPRLL